MNSAAFLSGVPFAGSLFLLVCHDGIANLSGAGKQCCVRDRPLDATVYKSEGLARSAADEQVVNKSGCLRGVSRQRAVAIERVMC